MISRRFGDEFREGKTTADGTTVTERSLVVDEIRVIFTIASFVRRGLGPSHVRVQPVRERFENNRRTYRDEKIALSAYAS